MFHSNFDPLPTTPSLRSLIGIVAFVLCGTALSVAGYVRSTRAVEEAFAEAATLEPPAWLHADDGFAADAAQTPRPIGAVQRPAHSVHGSVHPTTATGSTRRAGSFLRVSEGQCTASDESCSAPTSYTHPADS